MAKKYIVDLNKDEKAELVTLTQKGRPGARKIKRANILLLANGLRYWHWGGRGFCLGSRKNPKPEKRLKTAQNPASRLHAVLGGALSMDCSFIITLILTAETFIRNRNGNM